MSDRAATVHVGSVNGGGVATVGTADVPAYYVIIGRGVAAWYNHLTLLHGTKTEQRLGDLPVLHVGFKEPWAFRNEERMGQWPRMLNFFEGVDPGLQGLPPNLLNPNNRDSRTWLKSREFAASIARVEAYIKTKYQHLSEGANQKSDAEVLRCVGDAWTDRTRRSLLQIYDGFVWTIEKRPNGGARFAPDTQETASRAGITGCPAADWINADCPYRIPVYRKEGGVRTLRYFYAKKVDLCTGVSSARLPSFMEGAGGGIKTFCDLAFASQEEPPDQVRRNLEASKIFDGNTFIGSDNGGGGTVAVIKSGAVAAQSVQSALGMPRLRGGARSVWWISNDYFSKQNDLHTRLKASETVPGARNQLEIAGATPDEELVPLVRFNRNELLGMGPRREVTDAEQQRAELRAHFSDGANPVFAAAARDRVRLLKGKLHNLSHHELDSVAEVGGRLKITLKPAIPRTEQAAIDDETLFLDQRDRLRRTAETNARVRAAKALARLDSVSRGKPLFGVSRADRGGVQSVVVDKLVYSSGQDYALAGNPGGLCRHLRDFKLVMSALETWPQSIEAEERAVRILGGAMLAATARGGCFRHLAGHTAHIKTLPAEAPAAAGGGINPALINIRRANGFQYAKLKLNSASVDELEGHNGLSTSAAVAIVEKRKKTVRGCTIAEYRTHLGTDPDTQADVARLTDAFFQF